MRPKERRDSGQSDRFKARLDQIVDMGHPSLGVWSGHFLERVQLESFRLDCPSPADELEGGEAI